jgi:hypothetical protein
MNSLKDYDKKRGRGIYEMNGENKLQIRNATNDFLFLQKKMAAMALTCWLRMKTCG